LDGDFREYFPTLATAAPAPAVSVVVAEAVAVARVVVVATLDFVSVVVVGVAKGECREGDVVGEPIGEAAHAFRVVAQFIIKSIREKCHRRGIPIALLELKKKVV
jgi:hypothetical protein